MMGVKVGGDDDAEGLRRCWFEKTELLIGWEAEAVLLKRRC
jgi:hypothetical protein